MCIVPEGGERADEHELGHATAERAAASKHCSVLANAGCPLNGVAKDTGVSSELLCCNADKHLVTDRGGEVVLGKG